MKPTVESVRAIERSLADHAANTQRRAAELDAARPPTLVGEIARITGMKPDEIANVVERPEGVGIVSRDGSRLILVSADTPDAEGRTGLLIAPDCPIASARDASLPPLPLPIYEPHGRRHRLRDRMTRRKPEPTSAPAAIVDDELLRTLHSEVARAEALRDAAPPGTQQHTQATDLARVLKLRITSRGAELDELLPPTLGRAETRVLVAAVEWARAIVDNQDDERARAEALGEVLNRYPDMSTWRADLRTAERELRAARDGLAAHGLDEHGDLLADGAP